MTSLSLTAPQFSHAATPLIDWARFLEDGPLDGGFLFDHLVPIGNPSRPVLELAGALGLVCATTTSKDVGTLVMRATLRGPEISAGVAGAAGIVAPGRLVIGLGAGDRLSGVESERFGMPQGSLSERVGELREAAGTIVAAAPDVRVWVGGTHPRVLQVAAEAASGWNGWMIEPEQLAQISAELPSSHTITWGGAAIVGATETEVQRLVEDRGSADGVIAGTVDQVAGRLRRMVEAGADHLILSMLPNRIDRWQMAVQLKEKLA